MSAHRPPRWFFEIGVLMALLALVPLFFIARNRATHSKSPRIHVVTDMDNTISYKRQQANPLFADGRAMRMPVEGTVARGRLEEDDHYYRGVVDGEWAVDFPTAPEGEPSTQMSMELLERGRDRFTIYCTPCHGISGYGDGTVARRAEERMQATWVPPSSLHDALVRTRASGHLFNTISNGIRTMPAYGPQIPVSDRWAIVAYVRALQRSQHGTLEDVPQAARAGLGQ
jgi:mono/diheme cytochrome c family protein